MKRIKLILKNNQLLYSFLKKIYLPIRNAKHNKIRKIEYKRTVNQLNKSENSSKDKVFFIGIPIHNNLGDLAQWYCIGKWINKYYPTYEVIEVADYLINNNYKNIMSLIKNHCSKNDIFIFQSGYRTTDVENIFGEYAHRSILENFDNKVLVFPQTVNFKSNKESKKSSLAYNKNSNYIFLARDKVSYELAKKLYNPSRVELFPDIVTTLIGKYNFNNSRKGALFCLRKDNEKLYSDTHLEKLINSIRKKYNIIDRTDTNFNLSISELRENIESILMSKFEEFSNYKVVITDRYHGIIFSLISNTPVIVLSSTDHKLASGVDWFKNVYADYIYYAKDLEEAENLADMIINKNLSYKLDNYFEEKYYSKLKEKIINKFEVM